jgi:hypothetical protein
MGGAFRPHQLGARARGSDAPRPIPGRRKPTRRGRYGCKFGRRASALGAQASLKHPFYTPQAKAGPTKALGADRDPPKYPNVTEKTATLTLHTHDVTLSVRARPATDRQTVFTRQTAKLGPHGPPPQGRTPHADTRQFLVRSP